MGWEDPIVAEVRRAREDLFREAGGDMRRLFELLRAVERRRAAAGAEPAAGPSSGTEPPAGPSTR